MSSSDRDLRPLDAVRGVAAFMVILFHHEMPSHFGYFSDARLLGVSARALMQHGYLWVDMFLVLSGYILARKYGDLRPAGTGVWRAYLDFIVKRVARVYPLYLFMTAVVLLVWLLEGTHNPQHWPHEMLLQPMAVVVPNLLLIQAWGLAPSLDAPSWTLSAECLVYLSFPLVTARLLAGGRLAWLGNFAFVMALIVLLWWSTLGSPNTYDLHDFDDPRTLIRALCGFCLGVLVWRFEALRLVAHLPRWVRPCLAPAAAAFVIGTMASTGHEWLILLAFSVLLVALASAGARTLRVLNARILFAAGYLSYGVYLIHDQLHPLRRLLERSFMSILPNDAGHFLALALTVAACYGLAAISYRLIENPARAAMLNAWSQHKYRQRIATDPVS